MKRTLSLKRESVVELTSDELAGIVGGDIVASGLSCPVKDCLGPSQPVTCAGCDTGTGSIVC